MQTVPVILAGGIGERFWPLSRSSSPKQLHAVASERSMLEETLFRVRACCQNGAAPLLVVGAGIADKAADALRAVDTEVRILNRPTDGGDGMGIFMAAEAAVDIIAETQGKNTAPAIALAAAFISARYGDAVMIVLSADHAISPDDAFSRALERAVGIAAESGGLVVFGVKPTRPETGYGYIETGEPLPPGDGCVAFNVRRFVEKPNAGDAAAFMKSDSFLWNCGMFVWKASVILEAFKKHIPDLYGQAVAAADGGFTPEAIEEFYAAAGKESIDYGIMEKADAVSVVRGEFFWDDLGSWESLSRVFGSNGAGTTVNGDAVYEDGCVNSLVVNKSGRALAAIGLKDAAVIAVGDAVLAIDRSRLPELKRYLADIKNSGKFSADLF
jgi:mannose-1-phosphate guanylyltransferase/mannose-6-phosphate isomerase